MQTSRRLPTRRDETVGENGLSMAAKSTPDILFAETAPATAKTSIFDPMRHWWVAFAASTVFAVGGHLLIKAGLNTVAVTSIHAGLVTRIMHQLLQPQVAGGLLIYLMGTICWMAAVSRKEISFLYPLTSVNYVFVVATSAAVFHEAISLRRAGGVLFIVLGVVLMNRRSTGNSHES